jgi:hypothetical protein
MNNGVHCVSISDWWLKDSIKPLKSLPYIEQLISVDTSGNIEYNVIDRCIMEDCLYESIKTHMTPGSVLPECSDCIGKSVHGVMLSGITPQDVVTQTSSSNCAPDLTKMIHDIIMLCDTINENDYISTFTSLNDNKNNNRSESESGSDNKSESGSDNKSESGSDNKSESDSQSESGSDGPILDNNINKKRRYFADKTISRRGGGGRTIIQHCLVNKESYDESLITAIVLAEQYAEITCNTDYFKFRRLKMNRQRILKLKQKFCEKYNLVKNSGTMIIKQILSNHGKLIVCVNHNNNLIYDKISKVDLFCKKHEIVLVIQLTESRQWVPVSQAVIIQLRKQQKRS